MALINNAQLVKSGKNSTAPDILHFSSAGWRGGNNIATKTKQTRLFISSNTSGSCRPPRNIRQEVADEVVVTGGVARWTGGVVERVALVEVSSRWRTKGYEYQVQRVHSYHVSGTELFLGEQRWVTSFCGATLIDS